MRWSFLYHFFSNFDGGGSEREAEPTLSLEDGRPILLVDFDGVIHSYESGWQGANVINDPPVDGAFDFLLRAAEHFDVQVYSARSNQTGGIWAMKRWFKRHGWSCMTDGTPRVLEFPTEKPAAFLTIDDRCWRFEGEWPDPEALTQFRPWNGKKL